MPVTKFDVDLEGFFDLHFFYPISEFSMPIFRFFSFTPNMITTLSLVTVVLAIYYTFINTRIASAMIVLSYALDCADGMYARRYDMCSVFGMVYDYVKDGIMITLFYFALIYRYASHYGLNLWISFFFSLVAGYICLLGFRINETIGHYKKHHSTDYYSYAKKQIKEMTVPNIIYLSFVRFCHILVRPFVKDPKKMVSYAKILKFFGLGNMVIFTFIAMNIWVIA